jgi:hypothetical protein
MCRGDGVFVGVCSFSNSELPVGRLDHLVTVLRPVWWWHSAANAASDTSGSEWGSRVPRVAAGTNLQYGSLSSARPHSVAGTIFRLVLTALRESVKSEYVNSSKVIVLVELLVCSTTSTSSTSALGPRFRGNVVYSGKRSPLFDTLPLARSVVMDRHRWTTLNQWHWKSMHIRCIPWLHARALHRYVPSDVSLRIPTVVCLRCCHGSWLGVVHCLSGRIRHERRTFDWTCSASPFRSNWNCNNNMTTTSKQNRSTIEWI